MLSKLRIYAVLFLLMCVTSFGQNTYESETDSAWIAAQNGGRTDLNDGNNEPNPECIGDGCGETTFQTRTASSDSQASPTTKMPMQPTPTRTAKSTAHAKKVSIPPSIWDSAWLAA